ncbi:MAG: hypothetical protein WD739_07005 [Actinomycetota bacterium]
MRGSFSDHNLHTRGSFEGFRRIGSAHRWLYTHRDGKWATYYSPEALAFQERFFARFLKDERNGLDDLAPVRLEVRASRTEVVDVRAERDWPLPDTGWTTVHLTPVTERCVRKLRSQRRAWRSIRGEGRRRSRGPSPPTPS